MDKSQHHAFPRVTEVAARRNYVLYFWVLAHCHLCKEVTFQSSVRIFCKDSETKILTESQFKQERWSFQPGKPENTHLKLEELLIKHTSKYKHQNQVKQIGDNPVQKYRVFKRKFNFYFQTHTRI